MSGESFGNNPLDRVSGGIDKFYYKNAINQKVNN